jgi:hypothetical protein
MPGAILTPAPEHFNEPNWAAGSLGPGTLKESMMREILAMPQAMEYISGGILNPQLEGSAGGGAPFAF